MIAQCHSVNTLWLCNTVWYSIVISITQDKKTTLKMYWKTKKTLHHTVPAQHASIHTTQCGKIWYNTLRYNKIQYNAAQYSKVQYSPIRYIQDHTTQLQHNCKTSAVSSNSGKQKRKNDGKMGTTKEKWMNGHPRLRVAACCIKHISKCLVVVLWDAWIASKMSWIKVANPSTTSLA